MGGGGKRRGGRGLSKEERALWNRVALTAAPLSETERPTRTPPDTVGLDPAPPPPADAPLPDIPVPEEMRRNPRAALPAVRVTTLPPEMCPVGRPEAGLDRRTAERLRRGAKAPEARIDLHGMRAERAHRACLTFLADALARGLRVVLVITGKGRRGEGSYMGEGRGVLRDQLPGWLRASPIGHSIVGIYQAHQKHGGEGAYYIYLKKRR